MKSKNFLTLVLLLVIVAIAGLWKLTHSVQSPAGEDTYRNTAHLILTRHARCRMDCRHITLEDIKEIVRTGIVNTSKSGRGDKGDETYALEGVSQEREHLRVVVAPESDGLVVITCIDLDNEWHCNCD